MMFDWLLLLGLGVSLAANKVMLLRFCLCQRRNFSSYKQITLCSTQASISITLQSIVCGGNGRLVTARQALISPLSTTMKDTVNTMLT